MLPNDFIFDVARRFKNRFGNRFHSIPWAIAVALSLTASFTSSIAANADDTILHPQNLDSPFCYLAGGFRSWPLMEGAIPEQDQVLLTARRNGSIVAQGSVLEFDGLRVEVDRNGLLNIRAANSEEAAFQLEIKLERQGNVHERQVLTVRPAPPKRPISYVSDLVDDLIRIYWNAETRTFKPLSKGGFDQYFRRLQSQGVNRLIVWQSPFPLITDPQSFPKPDWERFAKQARAIIDCDELTAGMQATPQLKSYQWLKMMMEARLTPEFGKNYTKSASEHGISLTASFRPFEPALTKYYEIPVFDADGSYLWNFLPAASPTVNFHPDEVGFAHYREILREMGRTDAAELDSIEIAGIENSGSVVQQQQTGMPALEFLASPFPPLDETTFVLVRSADGNFHLQRFATIQSRAEARIPRLHGVQLRVVDDRLILKGIRLPQSARYLIIRAADDVEESIELPVVLRVSLLATAGNHLGRVNSYCSLRGDDAPSRSTRVAGIPNNGLYRTSFQAIENGIDLFRKSGASRWSLAKGDLVIDLGDRWSVEMIDLERAAARQIALQQLRTILATDAFDEIFINTRSHTQLAASTADGAEGIQPLAYYRLKGTNYAHYGIDRAYSPISVAEDTALTALPVEQITTWQKGEWQEPCETSESPFVWRYRRNLAVARGIRALLGDFEREFPGVRVRAVIPQSAAVTRSVKDGLETMRKPEGGVFGRDYFRHVWGSLNHIPSIGEGMTLVNLSELSVEPVFLGIRYLPDEGPFSLFVNRCIADLQQNRGSSFTGPRSFFYEAQETLRVADPKAARRREEIICKLLAHKTEIGEVILYEAADWIYYLSLPPNSSSVYDFLDRCNARRTKAP